MIKLKFCFLIVICGFLTGCEPNKNSVSDYPSKTINIVEIPNSYCRYTILKIDDKEYIVAYHSQGVAICPK